MDIISYALSKGNTQKAVTDYLDEHLTNPTNPPIDTSLSIAGAAADSKAAGDKLSELKEGLSDIKTPYENLFGNPEIDPNNTDANVTFANVTYSNGAYTFDTGKYSFSYRSNVLHELRTGKQYLLRIKAKAKNDGNNGIVINVSLVQGGSFIFPSTNILSKMNGAPADGQYDIIYPFTVSADGITPRFAVTFSFVKDSHWHAASDVDIVIYNVSIVECPESEQEHVHDLLKISPDDVVGGLPVVNRSDRALTAERSDFADVAENVAYSAYGKRILVLGDSIFSDGYHYVSDNLRTMLKPSVYTNVAVAGAKVCDTSASQVYDGNPTTGNANNVLGNQVQKVLNNKAIGTIGYSDFDYCIISCGANDGPANWGWTGPKPTYDGWIVPTEEDIESFFTGDINAGSTGNFIDISNIDRQNPIGALRWAVESLMTAYPNMIVFISNPIQCAQGKAGSNYLTNIHKCDIISRTARRLSAQSITAERCGIYGRFEEYPAEGEQYSEHQRYLQDGLHPNAAGGMVLARYVCDEIIKFFIAEGTAE